MKKNIKYLALPAMALGLFFNSCSLEEDNPGAGDATIKSFDSWQGMQAYCYSPLNNQLYSASDWLFCSEGGTDLWLAKSNGDGYRSDLYYENYSTNNNSTQKLWKQCYSMITNCNTVINEAASLQDGDAEKVKVLLAETKVLRAFYNFLLVSNFGPVTLNLESSPAVTGGADVRPVRTSEKVFYDQIEKDLKEALPDLGVKPYAENPARVTKKTALGLLARIYAQRAGLGKKYGDAEKYWGLCAETAEDLINNAGSYDAMLYTDIADMWADANNRNNKEALFVAVGPDANKEAYNYAGKNNKLLVYSSGGLYTDLFSSKHNPTKNGQCYFYGRLNNQVWTPSKYLLYCFDPEWDRRWEYTFTYAWSDYSMVEVGWAAYDTGQLKLTEALCTKYGIDPSHVGETIYPYADCNGIASGFGGNQYVAKVWPKGETSGSKDKLLTVAASSAEIGQAGKTGSTKAYAVPYPVALDDNRVNTVYTHRHLSDADKAQCRYAVVCLEDLFGSNDLPYGNVANGSEAGNSPKIGDGTTSASSCPGLIKFNWSYNGVFVGNNLQTKTGDMYIMRMAEIYLLAAEAEQQLGHGAKAAEYLNVLRKRAARPGVAESTWKLATATEDDIFDEYAREMCGEFQRWALLKRHNAFETRLEKYNSRAFKAFKPAYYNKPISNEFLQTILNDDQYGDNGYGQTPTSGLDNID